jgi:2-(1,2-epoxy-1,2-dihydrophenyl)acetyl-CoA isomerase
MPEGSTVRELVSAVYPALASGDRETLTALLDHDFEGTFTESLPFGIGGVHRGAEATIRDGWWAIGRAFAVRAETAEWIDCEGECLLVLGRYGGHARSTGAELDAAFAHLWTARGGKLVALRQLTDSARWLDALADTEYLEHSSSKEGYE